MYNLLEISSKHVEIEALSNFIVFQYIYILLEQTCKDGDIKTEISPYLLTSTHYLQFT
jgi:hypothetical protein